MADHKSLLVSNISEPDALASALVKHHNLSTFPFPSDRLILCGKSVVASCEKQDAAFLDACVWTIVTTQLGLVDDLTSVVYLEVYCFCLLLLQFDRFSA